jgi:hypothetical protein
VDDPAEAATFFATAFGMEVLPVTNDEEETVRVEAGQVVIALQKGRSSASGVGGSVLASLGIAGNRKVYLAGTIYTRPNFIYCVLVGGRSRWRMTVAVVVLVA